MNVRALVGSTAIALALACANAHAQTITQSILPPAVQQFSDNNGAPLASGTVGFYVPSTLTPKTTYQDAGGATPNPTVLTLDAGGRTTVPIYGQGLYRMIVKNVSGATIYDQVTYSPVVTNILTSPNTWTALQTFTGGVSIPGLPGLSSTLTPVAGGPFNGTTFGLSLANASQPWLIRGIATSLGVDNPGGLLYVTKGTAYSPPAGTTGEYPSIYGINVISDGVYNNQAGVLGSVYNSNTGHSQPLSTSSAVAIYGTGWCLVANCSATWGGVTAGYDLSGQANPPNPLIGLEVDNYAHGTDNSGNRVILQLVAGTPDGIGAANQVTHGILITGPGTGAGGGYLKNIMDAGVGTLVAQNGIVLNNVTFTPGGAGSFAFLSPGFSVDAAGTVTSNKQILQGTGGNLITVAASGAGNIMALNPATTFTNGIDLNTGTFSGFAYLSPNFSVDGTGIVTGRMIKPTTFSVATLPSCVPATYGNIATVNDSAVAPTYNTAIGAGGGIIQATVVCQGGSWAFH